MSSTIHDIFIRKILHLKPEEFDRYVEHEHSPRSLVTEYVRSTRSLGAGCIVITRKRNMITFKDTDSVVYLPVEDFAAHLISRDGLISEENFLRHLDRLLEPLLHQFGSVRIYSEMKDYLWENGHSLATAAVEAMWLRKSLNTDILILSAIQVKNLADNQAGLVFHCISKGHSQFLTRELLSQIQLNTFSSGAGSDAKVQGDIPSIMDVLTAEICHEARNPLSIIQTSAEILRDLNREGALTAENLEEKLRLIESSVERIDHILTVFGKRT